MRATLSRASTLALLVGLAGLVGCDSEEGPEDGSAGTGAMSMPSDPCSEQTGLDTYAAGIEKATASGDYRVAILDASPAPPDVGMNGWTIEVRDSAGEAVDGLSVEVEPFMPAHDHGTNPKTTAGAPNGTSGQYTFEDVNLFMSGTWTLTFGVRAEEGDTPDPAVFTFCFEG